MNSFIKVSEPAVIKELNDAGFTNIWETLNSVRVAIFDATPELIDYMQSKFSKAKFAYSNKIHF